MSGNGGVPATAVRWWTQRQRRWAMSAAGMVADDVGGKLRRAMLAVGSTADDAGLGRLRATLGDVDGVMIGSSGRCGGRGLGWRQTREGRGAQFFFSLFVFCFLLYIIFFCLILIFFVSLLSYIFLLHSLYSLSFFFLISKLWIVRYGRPLSCSVVRRFSVRSLVLPVRSSSTNSPCNARISSTMFGPSSLASLYQLFIELKRAQI